jgi:hypothetical protein
MMEKNQLSLAVIQCGCLCLVTLILAIATYNIVDRVMEGHVVVRSVYNYQVTPTK